MASSKRLFASDLVSKHVQSLLPDGFSLRPLERTDFDKGHLDVLRDLAHVGDITREAWIERFDWMDGCNNSYYVLVITDDNEDGRVVGTGTLFLEKKL